MEAPYVGNPPNTEVSDDFISNEDVRTLETWRENAVASIEEFETGRLDFNYGESVLPSIDKARAALVRVIEEIDDVLDTATIED